jgi:hypothetical protein
MARENTSSEVEKFLSKLNGVKQNGQNWSAQCPCRNDDKNPSLSIGQGTDGRVLVTCHRGIPCDVETICGSVGMTVSDLMPPKDIPKKKQRLTLVETYDYRDALGELLFQKQRFVDEDGKKTFRQRRVDPVSGEWVMNLDGIEKVLYNLPMICASRDNGETIWVVEGEKDSNTLINMGIPATTMPGGAGKWLDIHTETLAGAKIVIVADNDEVGKKHALDVSNKLIQAECQVSVKIADKVKDVTDLLKGGGKLEDLRDFDEMVDEPEAHDPYAPVLDKLHKLFEKDNLSHQAKIQRAERILLELDPQVVAVKNEGRLVEWGEFVNESETDTYDWVIPGLLERGERVMVVAAEGVGKTMLARQVALCVSSGLHPFTFEAIPPMRTLMIDLENPERIIRRTSRNIYNATLHYGNKHVPDAHLLIKPDGIDLMRMQDRMMIEEKLEIVKPDIVFLGPIYKSFIDPGGRTSESVAIEIAKYFDTLREYFKCAFWFEHHAPLGSAMASRDLRPFGSAVWSRWPEFGLSLQPDPTSVDGYVYEVRHFRGARDQRRWPTKMKRGKVFPFEVLEFLEGD